MPQEGSQQQVERCAYAPAPGDVLLGRFGRYVVGPHLGSGGFCAAYECTDDWNNQLVVKVLAPQDTYERVQARWSRESSNLIALRHPNITYVYDAFEYRNTFHIVVERCGGTVGTIPQLVNNYNGAEWVRPIARCVLQALSFIHSQGWVHKDIHPRNVLWALVPNGVAVESKSLVFKVADLGIARMVSELDSGTPTLAGWMMPPEALDPRQFGGIGTAVDIYHTALLLLSVAVGRTVEFTREEILGGRPRQEAEGLGPPFGPALARALRRHTSARTSSALELWTQLWTSEGISSSR